MAAVAVALSASACGAAGSTSSASPSPSPVATSTTQASPSPPTRTFKLNGVHATASGMMTLTARPPFGSALGSITLELVITGLQPTSIHVSHIHIGSCQQTGNIAYALNLVVADGQGDADTRSTLNLTYPPASNTWYVVVHAGPDMIGTNANYLLCGNLF